MPKVTCKTCGAKVPAPGMYCSAGLDLVCQGQPPVPGCGAVLTPDERHWYGYSCENCQVEWNDRINAWRAGGGDSALEEMFGAPGRGHH